MIYQNGKKIGSIKVIESAYMGASKKFKASKGLSLQPLKSVTITQNGTTNVVPDEGFDGMQSVDVNVEVPVPKEPYVLESYDSKCNLIHAKLAGNFSSVRSAMFSGCQSLQSVELPETIVKIMSSAFRDCSVLELESLPSKVGYIGEYGFFRCDKLNLKTLPSGISYIEREAFERCEVLDIELPNNISKIGYFAFARCPNLKLNKLPENTTYINICAFSNCENLQITSIPAKLSRLDRGAFYGCTKLSQITFMGTTNASDNTFGNCPNLSEIRVPWSEGEVANAPWGATNATIIYNYTEPETETEE